MAYQYPYGDSHQLNLDWLLSQWRSFQSAVCDMIAPEYSNKKEYPAGSLVIVNQVLYTNPEAINYYEEFTPEHWEKITLADYLSNQ